MLKNKFNFTSAVIRSIDLLVYQMFIAGRGVRNPGFHTRKGNHKISYFCIKTDKIYQYLHEYLFYGGKGGREEDSHSFLLYSVHVLFIGYLPVSYTSYTRDKLCHIHILDNSSNKSP